MGPDRAGGLPLVRDRGVEVLPDHDTGHIGNTLVPAVPGKGIVDAMVLATDDTDTTGTAELLAATGWDHARGSTPWCPFLLAGVEHDGNRTQARVHVVGAGSDEATAQRGLAAALREDPDLRQEYGSPKGEVVAEGTTNPARYSMKKTGRVLATRTGWGYRPCPTRASRDHRVDRRGAGSLRLSSRRSEGGAQLVDRAATCVLPSWRTDPIAPSRRTSLYGHAER